MTTNRSLTNPSSGQESTTIPSRTLLSGGLLALLSSPGRLAAQGANVSPGDPFILLLKGIYQPVASGQGPRSNLGLTTVNLGDGSYAKTLIYPVYGMPESREQGTAIGTFFVQFAGNLCAYDLPGGSLAMSFNAVPSGAPPGFNGFVPVPDGVGGLYLEAVRVSRAIRSLAPTRSSPNHVATTRAIVLRSLHNQTGRDDLSSAMRRSQCSSFCPVPLSLVRGFWKARQMNVALDKLRD